MKIIADVHYRVLRINILLFIKKS